MKYVWDHIIDSLRNLCFSVYSLINILWGTSMMRFMVPLRLIYPSLTIFQRLLNRYKRISSHGNLFISQGIGCNYYTINYGVTINSHVWNFSPPPSSFNSTLYLSSVLSLSSIKLPFSPNSINTMNKASTMNKSSSHSLDYGNFLS